MGFLHILAERAFLSALASPYSGAPRHDGWISEVKALISGLGSRVSGQGRLHQREATLAPQFGCHVT